MEGMSTTVSAKMWLNTDKSPFDESGGTSSELRGHSITSGFRGKIAELARLHKCIAAGEFQSQVSYSIRR
jgi:hypothetical protein